MSQLVSEKKKLAEHFLSVFSKIVGIMKFKEKTKNQGHNVQENATSPS